MVRFSSISGEATNYRSGFDVFLQKTINLPIKSVQVGEPVVSPRGINNPFAPRFGTIRYETLTRFLRIASFLLKTIHPSRAKNTLPPTTFA